MNATDLTVSSSNDDQLCKICKKNSRRYVCPKCSISYCSLDCYKSPAHLECSEAFYKKCVEEELHAQQSDPQLKQKTLDILQRIYDGDAEDDLLRDILEENEGEDAEDGDVDSDDDDVQSLDKRLENINLDNADELWSALTPSERQEFEALLQNGEASKLLPSWDPWWSYKSEKKLVQDLAESSQEKAYVSKSPTILDVPALESISKASPFIKYSIINAVYAYAYVALHLNGEHQSTPLDAIYIFLRTCETMRINRIFKDYTSAVENVLLEITNCDALIADQETILETKNAGDAIFSGPEEENKIFYVFAALSDLHALMYKAKKEIASHKSKSVNTEFKSKFQSNIDLGTTEVSKKNLALYLKKIEFYLAWLKSLSPTHDFLEETDDEKM